jgi:dienelactone hydrolase
MNPTRFLPSMLALAMLSQTASGVVKTELVEYRDGETVLEGFVAYDDAKSGPRPGVLVVHDWGGLGEYAQHRAKMLAELGYVAFAADIYGKGVRPADPAESARVAGGYKADLPLLRKRVNLGLEQLRKRPETNPQKVAAIGYCFGGTTVLELARSGADVAGVVSFHGGLGTTLPAAAGAVKARILVCHGADDPFVKPAEQAAFKDEMAKAQVKYQFVAYPDAVHSFTNPKAGDDKSKGNAYNAAADQQSWDAMRKFFAEILG